VSKQEIETMEHIETVSSDTPLPAIIDRIKKTGRRLVLTDDHGCPVADIGPHVDESSGFGMLNAHAPEGISASIEEIKEGIIVAGTKGFRT